MNTDKNIVSLMNCFLPLVAAIILVVIANTRMEEFFMGAFFNPNASPGLPEEYFWAPGRITGIYAVVYGIVICWQIVSLFPLVCFLFKCRAERQTRARMEKQKNREKGLEEEQAVKRANDRFRSSIKELSDIHFEVTQLAVRQLRGEPMPKGWEETVEGYRNRLSFLYSTLVGEKEFDETIFRETEERISRLDGPTTPRRRKKPTDDVTVH